VQASVGAYEVIVVDRMLPRLDGMAVVKTLRGAGNRAPVLMLTAVGGVNDRIEGLNAGRMITSSSPLPLVS
jgi:two-component system, OmpR family, response regulator